MFVHCSILGIPHLGLIHDWSKFHPIEWLGIGRNFFPSNPSEKENNYPLFKKAKIHHRKLNKHEIEHWYDENGESKEIPVIYLKEAMADWAAFQGLCFSKVQIQINVKKAYLKFAKNYKLTPANRNWIENFCNL